MQSSAMSANEVALQARVRRLEAVQDMVLQLDRVASAPVNREAFLAATHAAISHIIYAANFYVALYDAADNTLRFAYFVDEKDPPEDPHTRYPLGDDQVSPTAWVIRHRKLRVLTAEDDRRAGWHAASWSTGSTAEHWLGAPLLAHDGRALGAIVVQSYEPGRRYSDEDIALFGLIANHVAGAIERLHTTAGLEQTLAARSAQLEREIAERRHAEALQRGLYEIAALSSTDTGIDNVYRTVHEVTARLLYARNFFILLYHADREAISFPYFIDERDEPPPPDLRLPLTEGITSYVVRTRQPQLIDAERFRQLIRAGEIRDAKGNLDFVSWIGAPLLVGERLYGVIAVQSYETAIRYTQRDLELLAYMATHVASALARHEAAAQLREAASRLERRNERLANTLSQLRETQEELVRQEKLASLGGLVAGIAHEINTPLGICVTATSHLQEEVQAARTQIETGNIEQTQLLALLAEMDNALRILDSNTRRAAQLVRSFKQVAVDQSSGERRIFDLADYLDEVLLSLKPRLKAAPCRVEVECRKGIRMNSYPGALSQVITNLIMNALVHAFEGRSSGVIRVVARDDGDDVQISVSDNGIGMSAAELKQMFDPFYTTKRGQGGSGLGAHIAYNQTTGVLGGQIKVSSEPGAGLHVHLRLPRAPGLAPASSSPDQN